MPSYKVIYFDSRGRAETIRYIFAAAGVKYEDKRLSKEEWAEFKPKTRFGCLPVLEVDGKQLAGTEPIMRYLSEKFGLAGSNDFENAEIAGINDMLGDLAIKMIAAFFEKDETRKAELFKELAETHIPRYFGQTEKLITENGTKEGWVYGPKLTYADLNVYRMCEFLTQRDPKVLEKFPGIAKLKASVEAQPGMAKWLKERPEEKPSQ